MREISKKEDQMYEVEANDGGQVTQSEELEKQPEIGGEKCED